MTVTLIVDLLLVVLLAATIAAAIVLQRRLDALRADHGRLDAVAGRFADATARAEDGIGRLKLSTDALNDRLAAAEAVIADLRFLSEEANRAADRAESGVRALRAEGPRPIAAVAAAAPSAPAARAPARAPERAPEPAAVPRRQTEAERALIRALGMHSARSQAAP